MLLLRVYDDVSFVSFRDRFHYQLPPRVIHTHTVTLKRGFFLNREKESFFFRLLLLRIVIIMIIIPQDVPPQLYNTSAASILFLLHEAGRTHMDCAF